MRWTKIGEYTIVFIVGVLTALVVSAFTIFPKVSAKAEKTYVDESINSAKTECIVYTDKQIKDVKQDADKDKQELLTAIESVRKANDTNTDRIINAIKK
jgi:hypothetical protein